MQNLFETLNKLVSDEKIISIVKESYKSGFNLVRQLKTSRSSSELEQLFSRIESIGWLSRAFPMDIQFSQRGELPD
jgi:hypothetical protein